MGIVERLRAKPNRPTTKMQLGNGQEIDVPAISHSFEDDSLRKEAADRIELLEKVLYENLIEYDT